MGPFSKKSRTWLALAFAFAALPAPPRSHTSRSLADQPGRQRRSRHGTPIVPRTSSVPGGLQIPGAALTTGEIPVLPLRRRSRSGRSSRRCQWRALINYRSGPRRRRPLHKILRRHTATARPSPRPGQPSGIVGPAAGRARAEILRPNKPLVHDFFRGRRLGSGHLGPRRPPASPPSTSTCAMGPADIMRLIPTASIPAPQDQAHRARRYDGAYRSTLPRFPRRFFYGHRPLAHPTLINVLPEQQSHEVRLIKKIQVLNKDLQVLVPRPARRRIWWSAAS